MIVTETRQVFARGLVISKLWQTAFSIVNDAKFLGLFHLIGQIYTNLHVDHLARSCRFKIQGYIKDMLHVLYGNSIPTLHLHVQ